MIRIMPRIGPAPYIHKNETKQPNAQQERYTPGRQSIRARGDEFPMIPIHMRELMVCFTSVQDTGHWDLGVCRGLFIFSPPVGPCRRYFAICVYKDRVSARFTYLCLYIM